VGDEPNMKVVVKTLIALWTFGVPVYFGFRGLSIIAPIIWAAAMMAFALWTGWRQPGSGLLKSGLLALSFTLAAFIPLYFLGLWFS
jgi:hypothetical protein